MMLRTNHSAHNHAREPTAPLKSPPFPEGDRLRSISGSIGRHRNSNPPAIGSVEAASNANEYCALVRANAAIATFIVKKDRAEGPSCQELHPGLWHWLRDHSIIPDNVVTMLHPDGVAATKALVQKRTYASSKQRQVKHNALKDNLKGRGYWEASDRRPKSFKNSGQDLDPRSYTVQHRHAWDIQIRKLIAKNYQLEYVGDYPSQGDSSIPEAVGTIHLASDDDSFISEMRMIQGKISHDEAIANNYGTPIHQPVDRGYYSALSKQMYNDSELHRYRQALFEGIPTLTEQVIDSPSVVSTQPKPIDVHQEVMSLYRMRLNRPQALKIDPAPSRKVSRREMKAHHLDTQCFMDNRAKVFERTGYNMPSPTSTLCVAAKYQLWLHKHEVMNHALYTERMETSFNTTSYVPQVTRVEEHDKTPQTDRIFNKWAAEKSAQHGFIMESKRNKPTMNLTALLLEAGPPGVSVPGILTSLEAVNDPTNPDCPAQEVYGPTMPDEVSEMRNKVQRRKSNLSVFKQGGMSRPRARIASIEEAKHKVATYESSGKPAIVLYMPPEKSGVDLYSELNDDKADEFVKEFMK